MGTAIEDTPGETIRSFCGVGNPFKVGSLHEGETVPDIDCGHNRHRNVNVYCRIDVQGG